MSEIWRTGRKVGRTLYIHQDGEETGRLIGMVDTPELAEQICEAMNARPQQPPRRPCISPPADPARP